MIDPVSSRPRRSGPGGLAGIDATGILDRGQAAPRGDQQAWEGARIPIVARSRSLHQKAGYIEADLFRPSNENACRPGAGHTFAPALTPRRAGHPARNGSCLQPKKCRRVARRISLTTRSAGSLTGMDFCLIFAPLKGYDEPEILPSSTRKICLIGADAGQPRGTGTCD